MRLSASNVMERGRFGIDIRYHMTLLYLLTDSGRHGASSICPRPPPSTLPRPHMTCARPPHTEPG
jgi:hypothetical protein